VAEREVEGRHGSAGAPRSGERAWGAISGPPTNSDLIVRTLRAAGVTHGFGVPSGNVLPLMEAMRAGGLSCV